MVATVNLVLSGDSLVPQPAQAVRMVLGGASTTGQLVPSSVALPYNGRRPMLPRDAAAPWQRLRYTLPISARLPWGAAPSSGVGAAFRLPWGGRSVPAQRDSRLPWGGRAEGRFCSVALPWQRAGRLGVATGLRWGAAGQVGCAVRLPWALALLVVAPNEPYPFFPAPAPASGAARWVRLHLCGPLRSDRLRLRLGVHDCPPLDRGTLLIPARRTYMQVHTSTATRQPDGLPITLWSYELAADEGAIGWTLTASGPREILEQLAYDGGLPARLRVTLDGYDFDFIVEGLSSTREHGQFGAQITGRSVSALLTDMYSPKRRYLNGEQMTAQQVLADALAFTGVGLDWRLTDWLLPAGMWSFEGSAMAAVQRVAGAVGALVQSPRTGETVIVMPRYPVLPWNWSTTTPDFVVESLDPVLRESVSRADKPAYEGVYIVGTTQPVRALVKRTGTGPALLLPMISDALMTHLDAATQRGHAELAACGPQTRVTQVLPVLNGVGEAGIVDPGSLGRIDDPAGSWFGLVRSTRVTVSAVEEALSVRQSLTLERHL